MPSARSWPCRAHASARPADPGAHRDAHPDRAQRPVVAADRVVEEHHQAVAGEPLEGALEAEDQVAERLRGTPSRTPITSSGSLASANVVNPRRSQKTTTISRRWLSRNDSSPESTISSASCGRQEAPQPAHPLAAATTCVSTRDSSSLVPRGELVGLALDRVLVALDPGQRRHPGQQLALVDRLGQEVVGAGLERLDLLLVAARRHHHDRQVRRVRPARGSGGTPRSRPCRASRCRAARGRRPRLAMAASASSPDAAVRTSYPRGRRGSPRAAGCSAAGRRRRARVAGAGSSVMSYLPA